MNPGSTVLPWASMTVVQLCFPTETSSLAPSATILPSRMPTACTTLLPGFIVSTRPLMTIKSMWFLPLT